MPQSSTLRFSYMDTEGKTRFLSYGNAKEEISTAKVLKVRQALHENGDIFKYPISAMKGVKFIYKSYIDFDVLDTD